MSEPGFRDEPDEFDDDGCLDCGATGYVHDCGADPCCCADVTVQDMVICQACGGPS
jgi:hypothetical protein